MNPLLMALLSGVVLPMDAASQALTTQLQLNPKYSALFDAAARHPRVVQVSNTPQLPLLGRWEMGQNHDVIKMRNMSQDTLAHELTHFLLGNSPFNQTMPPNKQEYVAESFGQHGNQIPRLYPGELGEIYKSLISP